MPVIKETPLRAYKRQNYITDYIVRANLAPTMGPYPRKQLNGMARCKKSFIVCPFIKEGKHIKAEQFSWSINTPVNCNTRNIGFDALKKIENFDA